LDLRRKEKKKKHELERKGKQQSSDLGVWEGTVVAVSAAPSISSSKQWLNVQKAGAN
jgi:hypothetical protein